VVTVGLLLLAVRRPTSPSAGATRPAVSPCGSWNGQAACLLMDIQPSERPDSPRFPGPESTLLLRRIALQNPAPPNRGERRHTRKTVIQTRTNSCATAARQCVLPAPGALASFNGTDGQYPQADLVIDGSGNLYGTAGQGGAPGDGTVFEVARSVRRLCVLATWVRRAAMQPACSSSRGSTTMAALAASLTAVLERIWSNTWEAEGDGVLAKDPATPAW
jgi:uncharacterized repeat protein (TIGR03803 family)